jgi:hypothetical protein
MALMALSARLNWPTIPQTNPKGRPPKRAARETSFASAAWKPATHRGKMLKLINWKF